MEQDHSYGTKSHSTFRQITAFQKNVKILVFHRDVKREFRSLGTLRIVDWYLGCLDLQDRTYRLSQNVGNSLRIYSS